MPDHIKAYPKGISVEEMTLLHLAMVEDVHQHQHTIFVQFDDDEEKFFDILLIEY